MVPYPKLLEYVTRKAVTLSDHKTTSTPAEPAEKKNPRAAEKKPSASSHHKRSNVHVVTPSASYKWECLFCKPEKHPLYLCPKWQSYSVQQRLTQVQQKKLCNNCLAVGHATENCRSLYKCKECQQPHHTTLHQAVSPSTPVNAALSSQVPDALMMTAQVRLTGPRGESTLARALIDPGSGVSLVSSRMAQKLHLPLKKTDLGLSGVQGTVCEPARHVTELFFSPLQNKPAIKVNPLVVPVVTNEIPTQKLDSVDKFPHLVGLELADTTFNIPGNIDILFGADVYPQIHHDGKMIYGSESTPSAQATIFGWAIVGPVRSKGRFAQSVSSCAALLQPSDQSLTDQFQKYWVSEQPEPPPKPISIIEELVQLHYAQHVSYSPTDCRYTVALPWKEDVPPLGDSRVQAATRYFSNENSLERRGLLIEFNEIMQTYFILDHAELVPASEPRPIRYYYMPMHCVFKTSSTSTKIRVVFDGSAVTSSGISLNNSLMIGPTLHPTLIAIIIKFRFYRVPLSADITKMYRGVELAEGDRDVHRFLWRPSKQEPLRDYRMTRVTFGISASPYLAVRTLQQIAVDHGEGYPTAVQHILKSFYVDDLLAGADSEEEAMQLFDDLRRILLKGGFSLGAAPPLYFDTFLLSSMRNFLLRK